MTKKFSKAKLIVFVLVTMLCTIAANLSCYACWPWRTYQPEVPKSLIKED